MKKLNVIGLVIFALGAFLIIGYGIYEFVSRFLGDTEVPVVIRYGLAAAIAGLIIIIISLIQERIKDKDKEN